MRRTPIRNANGAVLVLIAVAVFAIIAIAALALDIGHLVVTKNELQNAADAGALAGARVLYINGGKDINPGANQAAIDGAVANKSDNTPVDSIEAVKGHWCFAQRQFWPNDNYYQTTALWGVTEAQLDADPNFINAVQVKAYRKTVKIGAWFAKIFGYSDFEQDATAVAYIGFAGQLEPLDVDMPIAICKQALGNPYSCTVGRFINSGNNQATSESGGWTDFNQIDPCQGGANRQTIKTAVNSGCSGGGANPTFLVLNQNMAMNNGQVQVEFTALRNCWWAATGGTKPWALTLPVIDCPGGIDVCNKVVGAVEVQVLWITEEGQGQVTAPTSMGTNTYSGNDAERWSAFVKDYSLKNLGGGDAPLSKKTIYFKPDCQPHEPTGVSGGPNFGILAKIPVLVN